MPRLLAALCFGLILTIAASAGPDDVPEDLAKWIETEPPGRNNDGWRVANQDVKHEWVVFLRDGHPRVWLRDEKDEAPSPLPFLIEPGSYKEGLDGRRLSAKVADGWIVAFNAGEFGAGLWWFSPDGKDRRWIAEAWIRGFMPTDAGLLALEGLAHGGTSQGRLIRLDRDQEGRWRCETVVDLKHAPEVGVKTADGSLIVATTDRLLRVVPADGKVEVLLERVFWRGLYPNSMVVAPSGDVYLGMRHGVAKIEKKGGSYKARWLLPNQAFVDMKPKEGFN